MSGPLRSFTGSNFIDRLIIFFHSRECDDRDRVMLTSKVIGASAIAVLRGLKETNQLDPTHFPNLENLLKKIYSFAEQMREMGSSKQEYGYFCKGVARRLFKNKSKADFALGINQLKEWANSNDLDEEDKAEIKAGIKKIAKKNFNDKPWYTAGKILDENDKSIFILSGVWKDYKECLAGSPRFPMRGPAEWDLSKWTAAERREFEFDAIGDDDSS